MHTILSRFLLFRVVLCAVAVLLIGITGAQAALLPADAPVKWKTWLGLDAPVGEAFKTRGLQAYQENDLQMAAALLLVARDFLPLDAEVIGKLGFALKELGRYEEAREALFQATIEDSENYYPWMWLGDVQRLMGEYTAAFQSMLTARDLAPEEEQETLQNFVSFTEQLGTAVPAWAIFERHREFAKRHGENRRYRRMIEEYMTALDLAPPLGFEEKDAELRVAWVLNDMGEQYSHLKETDVAIDYYLRSLAGYEKTSSTADVMLLNQNLAVAYSWLADRDPLRKNEHLDRALKHWEAVLPLARELNNLEYLRYAQAYYLTDLVSRFGMEHEETKRVRELNYRELPLRGPLPDYSTAAVGYGEAAARLAEEDWAGARVVLEMAIPYFQESDFLMDQEKAARLQASLARAYLNQEHYARALQIAGDGRQTLIDLRQYLDADAFNRSNNGKTLRHLASVAMRAALGEGNPDTAYDTFESYRQQERLDMLGSKVLDEAWRTDYATEADIIARRIPDIEKDLANAEAERDAYQSDRLQRRLEDDQNRLAWLNETTNLVPASRISVARIPRVPAEEAAASLPGGATLLGFVFDDEAGAAIVAGPNGISGASIALSEDDVRAQVRAFRSAVDAGEIETARAVAEALHGALIAPVRDQLAGAQLYVCVDETLGNLPFEALQQAGATLSDSFDIAYTASASFLNYSRKLETISTEGLKAVLARENDSSVLEGGFGNFPEKEALTGADATESAVYELKPRRPWLHVSAPADFATRDAMLSAVLLAADESNDGRFHATELLTASLPYNAVVLDIAVPAARDFLRGNAYAAFSEGLLHAGTATLVINRWTVPDATRTFFFNAFYGALAGQGVTKALEVGRDAVRQAEPESLNWASFALYGAAK